MLKNNLNVFYHFLRGGVERETTDTLGNTIYYNDSENEEEQELPNYYTTYTKNKSFINVKPTKVKKTNGKFEVISKKQFEKDKQAQKNILVPIEKPNKEEEEKKINEVRKFLIAKKLFEKVYPKRIIKDTEERKKYLQLDPEERQYYREIERREKNPNKKNDFEVSNEFIKQEYLKDVAKKDHTQRNKPLRNIYSGIGESNILTLLNDISQDKIYKKGEHSIGEDFIQKDFRIFDKNNNQIGISELKQVDYSPIQLNSYTLGLNKLVNDLDNDDFNPIKNFEAFYIFKDGSIKKITSNTIVEFGGKKTTFKSALKKIIDIVKFKKSSGDKNTDDEARKILKQKSYTGDKPKWYFESPPKWWKRYTIKNKDQLFLKTDEHLTQEEEKIFNEKRNKQDIKKIINEDEKDINEVNKKIDDNQKKMKLLEKDYNDKLKDITLYYQDIRNKIEEPSNKFWEISNNEKQKKINKYNDDFDKKLITKKEKDEKIKIANEEHKKNLNKPEYKELEAEKIDKLSKLRKEEATAKHEFKKNQEYNKLDYSIDNLKDFKKLKEGEKNFFKNKTIKI